MALRRGIVAAGMLMVVMGAIAGPAAAAGPSEAAARAACRHDALTFCTFQAIANNRKGVRDCLVRDLPKISEACRAVIKSAQAAKLQELETAGGAEPAH
jgi:hypothetical protein